MTKEEILYMEPGRELDTKVARVVMGHKVAEDEIMGYTEGIPSEDGSIVWGSLQPYSTEIKVAESVIDKMVKQGFAGAVSWSTFGGGKYTEPEAISKAALLAILQDY
jgi:hypothetical protein